MAFVTFKVKAVHVFDYNVLLKLGVSVKRTTTQFAAVDFLLVVRHVRFQPVIVQEIFATLVTLELLVVNLHVVVERLLADVDTLAAAHLAVLSALPDLVGLGRHFPLADHADQVGWVLKHIIIIIIIIGDGDGGIHLPMTGEVIVSPLLGLEPLAAPRAGEDSQGGDGVELSLSLSLLSLSLL